MRCLQCAMMFGWATWMHVACDRPYKKNHADVGGVCAGCVDNLCLLATYVVGAGVARSQSCRPVTVCICGQYALIAYGFGGA